MNCPYEKPAVRQAVLAADLRYKKRRNSGDRRSPLQKADGEDTAPTEIAHPAGVGTPCWGVFWRARGKK